MSFQKLRDYQIEDATFLAQLDACACFNEQRTGKTPTALYVCELKQLKKILIVCQASAIYPWVAEIQEWTHKPALAYVGTRATRKKLLQRWEYALVASYDTLKQLDADCKKEIYQLIKMKPDGVICDEAHRIGHHDTERSKAMFAIGTKIPFRMALSGSPAIGLSKDIWGILHFLYPKTFGSYWKFIGQFYQTSQGYGFGGRVLVEIGEIKPEMAPVLQGILRRISTQRKRKDVMAWLPAKDKQRVYLPLEPEQARHLEELETRWETDHIVTMGVLDRITRVRQVCVAPQLLGLSGDSPKTKWIHDFLKDYPDTPVLIFSKFTEYLNILHAKLNVPIISGAIPLKERNRICQQFQQGKHRALLLNIDACKETLTLDHAEAVIFTDKYPPIGDIEQAEDRFVATTMAGANKPHVIYELVMRDSYEEDILTMLAQRKTETDIVNDYKSKYERKAKHK